MTSGNLARVAVLGLALGACACGGEERARDAVPPGASREAPAAPELVRVALEIDGEQRGVLVVTERPTSLANLLPSGVKPLAEWERIHALATSERFVLVSDPAINNPGQVPMLHLDSAGRAVFAMVEVGADGKLPESAADLKKQPVAVHLAGVIRLGLWIDAEAPKPTLPEGQVALRHQGREALFGASEISAVVGAPLAFAGDGKAETAGGAERAPTGSGEKRKVGKPAGSPIGWPLADLLRKTVAGDAELLAIGVSTAQGEPITLDPKWWTEKHRFLGIRLNRKGEFVVHGYTLAERATAELEVRGVKLVEAITADEGRKGGKRGGPPEGSEGGGDRGKARGEGAGERLGAGDGRGSGRGTGGRHRSTADSVSGRSKPPAK